MTSKMNRIGRGKDMKQTGKRRGGGVGVEERNFPHLLLCGPIDLAFSLVNVNYKIHLASITGCVLGERTK